MFTGLVEEKGKVVNIRPIAEGLLLDIECVRVLEELKVNDSVSVSGICLTVISRDKRTFRVQAVQETIRRTTIRGWSRGTTVNLERACTPETRLGGHIVQGHVDGIGTVKRIKKMGQSAEWVIEIPESLARYCVEKGPIALDGISLTIANLKANMLIVALIPHTLKVTTFGDKRIGDHLNIEVDLLAKYIEKLILPEGTGGNPSVTGGKNISQDPGTNPEDLRRTKL